MTSGSPRASGAGPPRVLLRPGTPVLTRSAGVLQVGIDPPTVRLPDSPTTRRLLAALDRPAGLPAAGTDDGADGADRAAIEAALDRLRAAGLLLVVPAVGGGADVVLQAQFGPDAVRRRTARSQAVVVVDAPPATERLLDPLLRHAGVRRAATGGVHLVVATGALDRARLDPLVRDAVPHLVLTGGAAGRRLGPFVEPGRTACARCVDAHESLADVRRPFLLAQAAQAARTRPPPLDPVLEQLALAWAVRDLARYLEGDEPSTWSTTYDLGPVTAPRGVTWGRHPDCGCAWDAPSLLA